MMYKTAVVILNYNGLSYLKEFLPVTVRYSSSEKTAIIVADNGSTDGSAGWVESFFPGVILVKLDQNYGFAGGYNKVLQQIDAEYYMLLNSDAEVTEGWLDHLTDFMDKNPDVAAVQPKILSFHNRDCFEYAGASGGYIDEYGFAFCRGRIFGAIEKDTGQYNDIKEVFWTTGACMLVRASAWKKCGGFDESFFAHMEEIDLCWRFRAAGFRLYVIPDSEIYHVGGGSLAYGSPFKTYLNFRNSLYMLYKNLPERGFRRRLFARKMLDGIAFLFFAFQLKFSHSASVLKAHLSYYRNIRTLKPKREKNILLTENNLLKSDTVLNKCLVSEFYLKRKKYFSELKGFSF